MKSPTQQLDAAPTNLRVRAQALLGKPDKQANPRMDPSVALRVLFDLASSPATAHDALALLHELQVHQVELDLQTEELLNARSELEDIYSRQTQLIEASPSAQLVLDASGCLVDCNARALQCLQLARHQALGKRLEVWLDAADQPRVKSWLAQAHQTDEPISLGFALWIGVAAKLPVFAAARPNPLAPGELIAWVDSPKTLAVDVF
jgi:PAS domain-containing protein